MIHFEDLPPGHKIEIGPRTVTEAEIIRYAKRYDPMPFHTDPEAAGDSIFGRLCASGWHVGSMCMRMMVDGFLADADSRGGAGIDELRWVKPVFPGDELRLTCTVQTARTSRSKPDMGIVEFTWALLDQHGALKMTMRSTGLFGLRAPGAHGTNA